MLFRSDTLSFGSVALYRGEHTVRHKTQIRTRGISRIHHGGDDMFLRREPAFDAKLPRFLRLFYKNPVFFFDILFFY